MRNNIIKHNIEKTTQEVENMYQVLIHLSRQYRNFYYASSFPEMPAFRNKLTSVVITVIMCLFTK